MLTRYFVLLSIIVIGLAPSGRGFDLDSLLVKSIGGEAAMAKLEPVATAYWQGRMRLNDMVGTFKAYMVLPDKIRLEISLGKFTSTQVLNGQVAWQRDQNGQVNILSGFEKETLVSQAFFVTYSTLFDDRIPGGKEYLGVAEWAGVAYHKVGFYPLGVDTVYSYFDLVTGYQVYDVLQQDNLEIITRYDDHREYDGIVMARTATSTIAAAQVESEMTIDSIAFNVGIDQALFKLPESTIDYRFPQGNTFVTVPFDYIAGHIYLEAKVNGRRFAFILDSGASTNFFEKSVMAIDDLRVVGSLAAMGVAGYDQVDIVETDSINIGDLVLLSQLGAAAEMRTLSLKWSGDVPFGGILGYNFLSRFPVMVDYDRKQLTVYDPSRFVAPPGGYEIPFEYTKQIPTIEAELNGIPGKYIVDLGNAFGLIIHDEFFRANDFESSLINFEDLPGLVGGIGGEVKARTALAASFKFGDIQLADIRVMLPGKAGGLAGSVELAGNIGNLILQQFRVLFDYNRQRLVFYENRTVGD